MTAAVPGTGVRSVTVSDDREGQRLDNFLLGQLKGAPRSLIYKLVRSGQVRINGKRAKPDSRLDGGDIVRIPPVTLGPPADRGEAAPALLERLAASIVFEDERLLALNKPSGVASHGGSGISFGAIEALRQLRPNQSLELVHRLDRDTSGLLIIAKKRAALVELQALMREDRGSGQESSSSRQKPGSILILDQNSTMDSGFRRNDGKRKESAVGGIRKRYLALLVGRLAGENFTVDAPLEVGLRQGGERHVRVGQGGRESVSHFHLIERRGGHSYVDVRIDTGRTHQIRVHAAHLGHPVAGDDKYGEKEINKRLKEQAGLKRLFLHAASLEFSLDGGKVPYLLNAPLAPELGEALDRLG